MFPGFAEFQLVLAHIFVEAVHREEIAAACAAGRSLEARVLHDDLIDEDAAVAPAVHRNPPRIGDAQRDCVVDRGEHVLRIDMSPVGVDRFCEIEAAPGTAARIRRDHRVTVRRIPLPAEQEFMAELLDRAAMEIEDRGIGFPCLVANRLHQETVDLRPVVALEADVFRRLELHFVEQLVVLPRQRA